MSLDFRASQFRGAKFITSGSSAGGAKLVFYDISADDSSTPNQGIINSASFDTSAIGDDIFMYVSGTATTGSSTSRIAVFGGSTKISGVLGFSNAVWLEGSGSHLKFFDGENTSGLTLSSLAGGGDSVWAVSGVYATTTSSVALLTPDSFLQYTSSLTIRPVSASANQASVGITMYAGDGGRTSISGRDGHGGNFTFFAGTGSAAASPINGGAGGYFKFVGGNGGLGGSGLGGDGGSFIFTAGTGGNATNTAPGQGGDFYFVAGKGGTGFGAARGGNLYFSAGDSVLGGGGSARGGTVSFNLGAGGATSLTGRDGDLIVKGAAGNTSRVSFERLQKIAFGITDGVTTTTTGADTFMFISGTIGGKNSSAGRIAVFGGDVHISGNLTTTGGSGVGTSLQGAYNSGSTITVNSTSGSVLLTGNAGASTAVLTLQPTDNDETALNVHNVAGTYTLLQLYSEASNFGGAGVLLRSIAGTYGKIVWTNNSATTLSKGSGITGEIYHDDTNDELVLDGGSSNSKINLKDGGAYGGNLLVAQNAGATAAGQIYLLPNKANGIVMNSGSLRQSGSAVFYNGLSGSLTQLKDGTSYLRQGSGISITSASNGAVTFALSSTPVELSNSAPADLGPVASAGVDTTAARADHVHKLPQTVITTSLATAITVADSDDGKMYWCFGTTVTVTVPAGLTNGTTVAFIRGEGCDSVEIVADTGASLEYPNAFTPDAADTGSVVTITALGDADGSFPSDIVLVYGDLAIAVV